MKRSTKCSKLPKVAYCDGTSCELRVDMTELKRIQEYVQKNNILPKDCNYHTQRSTKNSKGQTTGKIRVLAIHGKAMVEYVCPECGHYGYTEQEWKRPFSTKCEKCNLKMGVPKMKQAFKKEQKMGKK